MGLSVLIVDEEQNTVETLRRALITSGFSSVTTRQGFSLAGDVLSGSPAFDVAILGLSPEHNDTMNFLEQLKKKHPETECLVITGLDDAGLAIESIRRGAFDYLVKPITRDKLIDAVKRADENRAIPRGPIRILILEDDPVSGKLMQKFLEPFGSRTLVTSGQQAVEAFRRAYDENAPFHLFMIDIMVPEIHGKDVLRIVRDMERESGIPDYKRTRCVMTSALGDSENIIESFHSKCDAYLIKPIDRKKLTDTLQGMGFHACLTGAV
jgi:two-component system, chemotaxis family, chemotaxis protein CheY